VKFAEGMERSSRPDVTGSFAADENEKHITLHPFLIFHFRIQAILAGLGRYVFIFPATVNSLDSLASSKNQSSLVKPQNQTDSEKEFVSSFLAKR
jgi:hypothetical protein